MAGVSHGDVREPVSSPTVLQAADRRDDRRRRICHDSQLVVRENPELTRCRKKPSWRIVMEICAPASPHPVFRVSTSWRRSLGPSSPTLEREAGGPPRDPTRPPRRLIKLAASRILATFPPPFSGVSGSERL